MRRVLVIAAVLMASSVGAQEWKGLPVIPLDRFDAKYGFPTFPEVVVVGGKSARVPYVFNGPNEKALRIGDVTKVPIINRYTPQGVRRR